MSVQRIRDIDINNRGLFVGLYGITGQEFFIDSDLKKYNYYQQLSIYLKDEGYDKVIMYDAINNFHSYFKSDLERLKYNDTKEENSLEDDMFIIGPLDLEEPIQGSDNQNASTTNSAIQLHSYNKNSQRNAFYRDEQNTFVPDYFREELSTPKGKTAFIIKDFK